MEVSDEMVEAALDRWFWNGWRKDHPMAAEWVVNMRSAIRAALAVMPDQYRAGWLAGRDATESHALTCSKQHEIVPAWVAEMILGIRGLEPPA